MKKIAIAAAVVSALVLTHVRTANANHNCRTDRAGYCTVKVGSLPTTVPAFLALRAKLKKDAFNAAALYIVALLNMSMNYERGKKMLLLSTSENRLSKSGKGPGVYKGYDFRRSYYYHLNRYKGSKRLNCFAGFAAGAKSADGKWVFNPRNVNVDVKVQTKYVPNVKTGRYKLFIKTVNRATPFPLHLRKNRRGIWKINNDSSSWTGCALPKRTTPSNAERDL